MLIKLTSTLRELYISTNFVIQADCVFQVKSDYEAPIDSLEQLVYDTNLKLTLRTDRTWAAENEPYFKQLGKG